MNRKTFVKGAVIGALFAFGAIAVMGIGEPGASPWVRLMQVWPGTPETGHINIDGNVGANGHVIQDNAPNDGYLEFPGEPKIYSRAELIGPKGDTGDTGDTGATGAAGSGGIKAIHDIFSNEVFRMTSFATPVQHVIVSPVFNVSEGDVLMVNLRKETTNIRMEGRPFAVLFELILEVESAPGGPWTTGSVLATTKIGMEIVSLPDTFVPRFSWTPHATYVVPPLGGLSGNVRLVIVGTASGTTYYEEFQGLALLPQTIRGEIVVM